jgi:hypothetical protein
VSLTADAVVDDPLAFAEIHLTFRNPDNASQAPEGLLPAGTDQVVKERDRQAVELAVRALGDRLVDDAQVWILLQPPRDGVAERFPIPRLGRREDLHPAQHGVTLVQVTCPARDTGSIGVAFDKHSGKPTIGRGTRDRGLDPALRYSSVSRCVATPPGRRGDLGDLARGSGKVAAMAKAKLKSAGYA